MVRPEIFLTNTGKANPLAVLDPRYHPLGQPGPRHRGPVWICKIPHGFRLPALVLGYCFICWNGRRWLFPHRARTIANIEMPIFTEDQVESMWWQRFTKQVDPFRWGHIYAKMQEERIRDAKKKGILPEDYPENEEQLNRMDPAKFESMMPEVKKIRFDVGVDRKDGVCFYSGQLPPDHGIAK
mmetsp:Transcript_58727/g.93360  ORF Transcript_58727/g.93360 Transcript_58727/m.93360 type:complete len:183 (-) Transcript_58727:211-759(-)|eukprot:CAMPEP_0197036076 /NCGR_PEP_ID=MMETSP1384-20130603/13688_1 /TAXON_ID=29189 /ORGANISM="Ammonia sp." /LENGTH=182 /DNA_ID=CAMNT_0042466209 /DNA_START=66 /DNA_END=614 /DNA_ORIENTATION=+